MDRKFVKWKKRTPTPHPIRRDHKLGFTAQEIAYLQNGVMRAKYRKYFGDDSGKVVLDDADSHPSHPALSLRVPGK